MDDVFFKTREETQAWLDEMGVTGYTIHDDLLVDVKARVIITYKNLTRIPVRFGVVSGDFYCQDNQLTSLVGCPISCINFDCDNNDLTDLTGAPDKCEFFRCDWNRLISLSGAPSKCGTFSCDNNQLTNLIGAPRECEAMWCRDNHLASLDGVSGSCMRVYCYGNPDLHDTSAAPTGCTLFYDQDVVAKNQAARQLSELESFSAGSEETSRPKSGRLL